MTEIRFYHLERKTLDQALPEILSKALSGGRRVVVKTNDAKRVQALNEHLWTYQPDSFLPHGSEKEGLAEDQPIWLTDKDENPNNADVLVLTDGTLSEDMKKYNLCCEMLDGRNQDDISAARERWKTYKEQGFDITYWQQDQNGRWNKKS